MKPSKLSGSIDPDPKIRARSQHVTAPMAKLPDINSTSIRKLALRPSGT
jgi:hypothetical protein